MLPTIQVVMEPSLLQAADRASRRLRVNRSAVIRDALRRYLKRLDALEKERRDREGYERRPQGRDELEAWDRTAAWPEE